MFKYLLLIFLFYISLVFNYASGHGMVLDPINRSSRWRYNNSAPINFEDNQLFCGGSGVQWFQNDGKCGLCGDNWQDSVPRPNELGGVYGDGSIVRSYLKNSVLPVSVLITANHIGYFYFKLCNLDKSSESETCFNEHHLKLTNGSMFYYVPTAEVGFFNMTLQLPENLTCDHCVLQWTYRTGNSWGFCDDGTGHLGCGPQEHFRTCSDLSIIGVNESTPTDLPIDFEVNVQLENDNSEASEGSEDSEDKEDNGKCVESVESVDILE